MKENSRYGWIDALRVLACFLVVLSHCCDGFVAASDSDREAFLTGALIGSGVRACVPLFVMMTAVLLLPIHRQTSLGAFYGKRVWRLIPPLIFWSLALPIAGYLYYTGPGTGSLNPSVDAGGYGVDTLIYRLWSWVLNFNFDTTPLWYLYMLVGLYMVMPILNSWLSVASKRDVETALGVWGLTLLLPYISIVAPMIGYEGNYGNSGILGVCDWNVYGTFYYMSGFIGYVILAYYLKEYPLQWSMGKLASVGGAMFVVGYAITAGLFLWFQSRYPGQYAYLEIAWLFSGFNVFLMTAPIFALMQRLKIGEYKWLRRLAELTFGIYLCHFIFVLIGYDILNIPGVPYTVRILLNAIISFTAAGVLTALLSANKLTARLVR